MQDSQGNQPPEVIIGSIIEVTSEFASEIEVEREERE
jgi:hypothetical protein